MLNPELANLLKKKKENEALNLTKEMFIYGSALVVANQEQQNKHEKLKRDWERIVEINKE